MDSAHSPESFRSQLLLHRGRSRLTQRDLALRAGVSLRSIQDWEAGATLPTAERLQALLRALLEANSLTPGHELSDARELWSAVEREAPRMRTPFDDEWFAALMDARASASPVTNNSLHAVGAGEPCERAHDWGEAPDTAALVGRREELARLQTWVLEERCRLVALVGIGGIGKTSLAAILAHTVSPSFSRVYWRTLRNTPPLTEWVTGALAFLSDQQAVPTASESAQISALLQLLRARRCMLVLDNAETLFEPGLREGRYRTGMDGYGRLLQALGESPHQSCLLLTSREAPPELPVLGGGVRALELHGLSVMEAQSLLADKRLVGDPQAWLGLVNQYGGNALALKIVSETIRQVYDGDIAGFLTDAMTTYGTVFGGIRRMLETQLERLSPTEHDLLNTLAIRREPISLAQLSRDMAPKMGRNVVLEAIETLRRRSLLERVDGGTMFRLQSMVLDYVTVRLAEAARDHIELREPPLTKI